MGGKCERHAMPRSIKLPKIATGPSDARRIGLDQEGRCAMGKEQHNESILFSPNNLTFFTNHNNSSPILANPFTNTLHLFTQMLILQVSTKRLSRTGFVVSEEFLLKVILPGFNTSGRLIQVPKKLHSVVLVLSFP